MKSLIALILLSSIVSAAPHRLGWKSNPRHAKGLIQIVKNPKYKLAPLPASASVSILVPDAYDQGDLGSCTANAGCAAFDAKWKVQKGAFINPSRLDLYQQELIHDGNYPNDAGSYTSTILWVLTQKGVALEQCWPYDTSKLASNPPNCAVVSRANYMAVKAYDVPNDDNGYSVKQCIANIKIPVITGGYVYENIFNPIYDVGTGKYFVGMPKGSPVGGHEILIVSYDDNLTIGKITGWAEIHNSWGKSYGSQGNVWLPYKYIFNPRQFEDNGAIEITK